jgi:protein-tyrosine kinase
MSRIYEALRNTENPVARMIEHEQRSQPVAAALSEAITGREEAFGTRQMAFSNRREPIDAPPETVAPREIAYRMVQLKAKSGDPVLPFDEIDYRAAECYRTLRTNILHRSANLRTIAISSAGPGDGKTITSINLAGVLALKTDARVLLIDADLRRYGVARKLGIDRSPGLGEVLTGACSLDDAIVQTMNLPNLFVLPAGSSLPNPTELLDSSVWRGLIASVREQFEFIIIDTTPIGAVADFALVERVCDRTILVARPDHTERKGFLEALRSVSEEKLLGVVLNHTKEWFLWRSYDSYDRS